MTESVCDRDCFLSFTRLARVTDCALVATASGRVFPARASLGHECSSISDEGHTHPSLGPVRSVVPREDFWGVREEHPR